MLLEPAQHSFQHLLIGLWSGQAYLGRHSQNILPAILFPAMMLAVSYPELEKVDFRIVSGFELVGGYT